MIWVYDLETYKSCFTATFKEYKTKEVKQFVIFNDRDDSEELLNFIDNNDLWLAGYNNQHFDNQLLKYMLENRFMYFGETPSNIAKHIYDFAQKVIEDEWKGHMYRLPFKSLDLMKIGNLNHKSLKLTGTLFKWHKLQDLPYALDHDVQPDELDNILKYNLNDVEITEKLMSLLEPQIRLRFNVSKEYNIHAYSETDSGIANKLLEKFYEEATNIPKQRFKKWRTKRSRIGFWDVIFPDISFRTPELHKFLDELRQTVFYPAIPFTKKSVIFDGVKYIVGVGGLHSEDRPDIFESNDHMKYIDADISSMYPNMMINNNIYPQHLGDAFMRKFKEVVEGRVEAKHKAKDKRLNTESRDRWLNIANIFKIIVNSVFGKMGFEHYWLYDPLAMLKVTINGQLYLLMLIEQLVKKGFTIISANTDGIIAEVSKDREDEYKNICKKFEEATKFDLEYTYYKKYARSSVNDYIGITEDGVVKTKGDFNIPNVDNLHNDTFMLRRGFDRPVIAIALNEFFKNNTPIQKTILEHKDIYDFCTARKTDKKFQNEFHYVKDGIAHKDLLQHSVRYYVSTDGGSLYKKDNEIGKMINYCVGKRVTIFNDYYDGEYNIDYNYYIHETQKIIDQIIKPQLTLF